MPSIRVCETEFFCLRRLVISSVMRESLSILKATDSHCPSVVSAGRTVCRALLEIRLQHGPGACEGLLGEFVVTAVSGCGVGQQDLHGLRIVLADGVELQFVGKLARLDLPDAFGCRQFDESVGGEVLHRIGHEHHVHARVLGQLQCVRHTGHRFRVRRVGCVIRAGCIRRFGCVSRFRCIR